MPQAYRIKDWNRHFEVAQSRKIEKPNWVAIPNKHDGKSYRRLMRMPNGPQLYGAWILILQVASKCPVRGLLADECGPLDADDLQDKTDCSAELFLEALEILTTPKIGWLERVEIGDELPCHQEQLPGCSHSTGRGLVAEWEHAPDTGKTGKTDRQTSITGKTGREGSASASPEIDGLDWERIRQMANELQRLVPVRKENDRRLLLGSCALVVSGRLSEDWLRGAAETTAEKATGNRAAYFTKALYGRADEKYGIKNLNALLAAVRIPEEIRL